MFKKESTWGVLTSLFFILAVTCSVLYGMYEKIGGFESGEYREVIVVLAVLTTVLWIVTLLSFLAWLYRYNVRG